MVNTTTSNIDFESGAVSSSILAQAGPSLQDECRTKYPGGVKTGDIAITTGHALKVKSVYHLALANWSSVNSKQVIYKKNFGED